MCGLNLHLVYSEHLIGLGFLLVSLFWIECRVHLILGFFYFGIGFEALSLHNLRFHF